MHYLDYAATAPISQRALEAWTRAQRDLGVVPGNPAALHSGGRTARRMLEDARERIGSALGADRHEVILTSGATESDALGVVGAARGIRKKDDARTVVLSSLVEHDAVAEQQALLEGEGFAWRTLPLGQDGVSIIGQDALASTRDTIAVASMAWVSSEIGTIQPVSELVRGLHDGDEAHGDSRPLVHSDAAQAVTTVAVNFEESGLDLLTVGGHKVGAPVGTGVLLARRGVPLSTDRPGGGHERGLRSGTPDVAGACALAAALEESVQRRDEWTRKAALLRDRLIAGLPAGVATTVPVNCACPAIIHLSLPTSRPEAVLMAMDMAGVMVSAGSACHAGVTRPSAIVMRLGRSEEQALGVLRISTGFDTTEDDIDAFLTALPQAIRAGQSLDQVEHVQSGRSKR